jgi:diguanylate cyclase (GGDEF)-like protein
VVAGVSYAILAFALVRLVSVGQVGPLVWLPSGLAIAALYLVPERRWPEMLAGLGVGQIASMLLLGSPLLTAIGLSIALAIEAVICASVGLRLFDGQFNLPNQFASLGTLLVVAVLGASGSALVALPVHETVSGLEFAHRLIAHVIGIFSVTPVLLYLYDRIWPEAGVRRLDMMLSRPGLPVALLGLFSLAVAVLYWLPGPMLLLLVVGIVLAVIRYGQLAASTGVLAYAAAVMIAQSGGSSPPALQDFTPEAASLIMQVALLLMLLTSLPLSTLLLTFDRLKAKLLSQNAELEESLQVLTMAETLAGIGRWRLDLRSGRQHWSAAMLTMNGLDPRAGADPGDVTALLPDGGKALFSKLADNRAERQPYTIEYSIQPDGGADRFLRMVVSNEFNEQGERIAVFGVAIEITEQVYRERALRMARQHALELAARAQKLALTDPLTGLANRRCVFEQLTRMAQISPQSGEPLTLVLFDIDYFKRVNDTHGHQAGDAVLQRIAELARRQARSEDLVGRIGGEEFVWLLPGVHAGRAREMAERLRRSIERESADGDLPQVTVSLGIALLRLGDTPEQLVARADRALYHAKESGRNCVQRAA